MIVGFSDRGWEDYQHWINADKKILKRINLLLEDIKRNPDDSDEKWVSGTLLKFREIV